MHLRFLDLDLNKKNLVGKVLFSAPYIEIEPCFAKSVIYILSHDINGTLGVIVNRVITSVKADFLFHAFNLEISPNFDAPIHFGGPVEAEKGLILHSNDYEGEILLKAGNNLSLSSNINILKDIAIGKGPTNSILALGYTGWASGQLENEIKQNVWIAAQYEPELIFSSNQENKWHKAISSITRNHANYSTDCGHA